MTDRAQFATGRSALAAHIRANPVDGSPAQMRAAFDRLAGPQPTLDRVEISGVPCVRAGSGPVGAVWLHGGGYVFGGSGSHSHAAAHLARCLGQAVLLPLYRLAPEHPWPAPLSDALAVLDALPSAPVAVVGDSAGGHLALHVAFARPGRVRRFALISANTDRSGLSRCRAENSATDLMNDDAQDAALARMAMPDISVDSVNASPITGPLDRLPPTWITCSAAEVLVDDSLRLARSAALSGVPVALQVERDLFHMWTLWPHILPEAARTIARIADHFSAAGGPDGTTPAPGR